MAKQAKQAKQASKAKQAKQAEEAKQAKQEAQGATALVPLALTEQAEEELSSDDLVEEEDPCPPTDAQGEVIAHAPASPAYVRDATGAYPVAVAPNFGGTGATREERLEYNKRNQAWRKGLPFPMLVNLRMASALEALASVSGDVTASLGAGDAFAEGFRGWLAAGQRQASDALSLPDAKVRATTRVARKGFAPMVGVWCRLSVTALDRIEEETADRPADERLEIVAEDGKARFRCRTNTGKFRRVWIKDMIAA